MLNREQTDYLLTKAYNAALRAGAAILDIYNDGSEVEVDMKSDQTPLTKADVMAHTTIKGYLGQTHIPLLSEEGRDLLYEERRGWDLFWMVDPLDGTKEFLKGNGEFTVNIALLYNNVPALGVIYVPFINKMYFAVKGEGVSHLKDNVMPDHEAELGLEDIFGGAVDLPSVDRRNEPLRIAVSRSHNTPLTMEHVERIKRSYPDAIVVEQGSSYKFCMLAEGAVDTYVRTTDTYEWDTAAGDIILAEAGGRVTELGSGKQLDYNKVSLLNPHFECSSKFF